MQKKWRSSFPLARALGEIALIEKKGSNKSKTYGAFSWQI
jgi:hypothetical protein